MPVMPFWPVKLSVSPDNQARCDRHRRAGQVGDPSIDTARSACHRAAPSGLPPVKVAVPPAMTVGGPCTCDCAGVGRRCCCSSPSLTVHVVRAVSPPPPVGSSLGEAVGDRVQRGLVLRQLCRRARQRQHAMPQLVVTIDAVLVGEIQRVAGIEARRDRHRRTGQLSPLSASVTINAPSSVTGGRSRP